MNEGKCECPGVISAVACGSAIMGVLGTILAIVSRLTGFAPMRVGPRSFAAGAALMLLTSITFHLCKSVCFSPKN